MARFYFMHMTGEVSARLAFQGHTYQGHSREIKQQYRTYPRREKSGETRPTLDLLLPGLTPRQYLAGRVIQGGNFLMHMEQH